MLTVQVQLLFRDPVNGPFMRTICGSTELVDRDALAAIENSKSVALDKLVAIELAKVKAEE